MEKQAVMTVFVVMQEVQDYDTCEVLVGIYSTKEGADAFVEKYELQEKIAGRSKPILQITEHTVDA